ncbi:MAG TPA: hypothetical protein VIU64_00555, partial [Polyangia bacterium]
MGRPVVEAPPRPRSSALVTTLTVLLSMRGAAAAAAADEVALTSDEEKAAAHLVGTRPPEWRASEWLNTAPLRLQDLRGKVVVVRWWTAGCPYCSASAP